LRALLLATESAWGQSCPHAAHVGVPAGHTKPHSTCRLSARPVVARTWRGRRRQMAASTPWNTAPLAGRATSLAEPLKFSCGRRPLVDSTDCARAHGADGEEPPTRPSGRHRTRLQCA
jgi:hypothetical protein